MTTIDGSEITMERSEGRLNAVHELHQNISSVFEDQGSEQVDLSTTAGACLEPLLNALNWTGEQRHLQEALPHFDSINDINSLRAALARLNFQTIPKKRKLSSLPDDVFPCLFSPGGEDLIVVISRRDNYQLEIFNGISKKFEVIDPESISGTVYFMRPIDRVELQKEIARRGWVITLFSRFRRTFFGLFMLSFVINCLALAIPIYIMNVYDKAIGAKSVTTLAFLFFGIAIVLGTDILMRTIRSRYLAYLGTRIENLITIGAYQQLLHLPISMTESAPIGAQITRLKQFESVREIFTGSLANTVLDLPFFAVFLIAIFAIGGPLGWIPVTLSVLYAVMAIVTIPLTKNYVARAGMAKTQSRNFMVELTTKRDTIRDNASEEIWIDRYRDVAGKFLAIQFSTQQLNLTIQTVSQAFMMLAGAATAGLGTLLVIDGQLSTGALIAVMALIWRILSPVQAVFLGLNRLGQAFESFLQINNLMKLQPESQPGQLPTFYRKFEGHITARGVAFRYNAKSEPALGSISLDISPGEIIAISGPSGVGKSTFLKIMARLYQPQAGVILLDGLDMRQIDAPELRHSIGYVPQRPKFFYGSIAQNLRLSHPTATRDDMMDALRSAGALKAVQNLEHGIDTRMKSEASQIFSNGLMQQLMLARAFVKKASIYLLDEPGSNLDGEGDRILMDKISSLRGNSTVIMATHRPSHMRLADRLLILDQGTVVADGKPDEIIPQILGQMKKRA